MAKAQRKAQAKLDLRIASWEEIRNKKGFTKPGSRNRKKQVGGTERGAGRRR